MKKLKILSTTLLVALGIFVSSCDDKEVAPLGIQNPSASNIIAKMSQIPDLSIMLQALNKTGLTDTFNGTDQYTVYAPNNAAFTAFLTANSFANLDAVPTADLKNVLLNHVINGRIAIDAIDYGYYTTLAKYPNTSTSAIIISSARGVNETASISASLRNINASNGIVHVTNTVVPFGTVRNLTLGNANLSTLRGYILATGADAQPDIVSALTAATNKTVFAPTNAAFVTALAKAVVDPPKPAGFLFGNINQANVNSLLKYHVIDGNRLSTSLMDGNVIDTFLTIPTQRTIQVSKTGSTISLIDSGATANAKVTIGDVQASDGVLHIISQVMNPF